MFKIISFYTGYTDGTVVNGLFMLTEEFLNEMAVKLAAFHSIKYELPGVEFKTHYDRVMLQVGPAFKGKSNLLNSSNFKSSSLKNG